MFQVGSALGHVFKLSKYTESVRVYETHANELNFNKNNFPVDISSINRFEMLNTNISINVYTIEKKVDLLNKKMFLSENYFYVRSIFVLFLFLRISIENSSFLPEPHFFHPIIFTNKNRTRKI